eukprot:366043-Chlamydomonas_euryale.AAC.6
MTYQRHAHTGDVRDCPHDGSNQITQCRRAVAPWLAYGSLAPHSGPGKRRPCTSVQGIHGSHGSHGRHRGSYVSTPIYLGCLSRLE